MRDAFKASAGTPGLFAVIITDNGLATGSPIGIATPWDFMLRHSKDFRSVVVRDREFTLTKRQAKVVKVLYEAYQNGTTELSEEQITRDIDEPGSRLRDSFRGSDAWGNLVIPGKHRGGRRLNL